MAKYFLALILLVQSAFADQEFDQELSALLPHGCYHSGNYVQIKSFVSLPEPIKSSGSFLYACDKGLLWQSREPHLESLIYTISQKSFRVAETGAVEEVQQRVHKELGKLLNKLVGGDLAYLQRKFLIEKELENFRLIPKSKRMRNFLQSIELTPVDGGVHLVLRHKEQEATAMQISNAQHVPQYSDLKCEENMLQGNVICSLLQE